MCATSTSGGIHILDAFTGVQRHKLEGSNFVGSEEMEASFSPCSRFLFAGAADGDIHMWNTATGEEEAVLQGHMEAVGPVQMNPKFMMLASACASSLSFWAPNPGT